MNADRRFIVDEQGYVVDTLNPVNSGKSRDFTSAFSEDKYLRELVLRARLGEITDKLIPNFDPPNKLPDGSEYKIRHSGSTSMEKAIFNVIRPSHLNTFDPMLSVRHRFDGTLKRQKERHQDLTSLALFRDEVERLLRELYGDFESEVLESVLLGVSQIVTTIASYVCPDLYREECAAASLDFMLGIGVPEELWGSGSDWSRGMEAKTHLIARVGDMIASSSCFSEYTVEFANRFNKRWDCGLDSLSPSERMGNSKDRTACDGF